MNFFVLGLGRSGFAAARFLKAKGYEVLVWDDHTQTRKDALAQGFKVVPFSGCFSSFLSSLPFKTTWVVSPGIDPSPFKKEVEQAGHRIIGDIQLFFDFFPTVKAVGVTGSNGKSTTCSLIHHALKKNGVPSALAGNIGIPLFSTLIENQAQDVLYILELSSYQLETCEALPLGIGLLLNIVPHHLERHGTLEAYRAIKKKIFEFSKINIGPPEFKKDFPHIVSFNLEEKLSLPPVLQTSHNRLNSAAAFCVLKALGHEDKNAFEGFKGLAHRQEWVSSFRGITYWNDSKATNPHATIRAIEALDRDPLYWIAGGVLQEDDLVPFIPVLSRINHAFLIGESARRYADFLSAHQVPAIVSGTLEEAVAQATHRAGAHRKAHILLSPACASFDQFKDFCHRGEVFKQLVHRYGRLQGE